MIANKVNTNYRNVIIRGSISFLVYIWKMKGERKNVSDVFDSLINSKTINNIIKYEIAY